MTEAKKIVTNILSIRKKEFGKLSVSRGRGTAYGWIHIKTDKPIPSYFKVEIEKKLLDNNICGSYWPDDGFSQGNEPCVIFSNHIGRMQ